MRFRLFGTMSAPTWILPSGIIVPVVRARVTLLPELSRGRGLLRTGQYRPHIVIGPQSQRAAIFGGNVCAENYLGVMFVGGPEAIVPGESSRSALRCCTFQKCPTMKSPREPRSLFAKDRTLWASVSSCLVSTNQPKTGSSVDATDLLCPYFRQWPVHRTSATTATSSFE